MSGKTPVLEAEPLRVDRQFLRFASVGASSFVLNLATLYACTDLLGIHYLGSAWLSLGVVTLWSYALNRRLAFRVAHNRPQAIRHAAQMLASFCLGLAWMHWLVAVIGLHYLIANALVAALMLLANFVIARTWVFRRAGATPGQSGPGVQAGSQRQT